MKNLSLFPNILFFLISFLIQSNPLQAQITINIVEIVPISCPGQSDAIIHVIATPGGMHTYTLDGSISNSNGFFYPIGAGTYTVCATDGSSTTCETIVLIEPDPFDITFITNSMVSCHGDDGVMQVDITGGTNLLQGYLTWWTNTGGDTLNDVISNPFAYSLNNLDSGIIKVTIKDDNGCQYDESTIIETAAPISVNANFSPIPCHNGSTIVLPIGTGGMMYPPLYSSTLTYLINGASVATNYAAGTYTITATDDYNCSAQSVITIPNPPDLSGASNITGCDVYTWPCNGMTYTTSGVYTCTTAASNGCDSMITLTLTIDYSSSSLLEVTACDSYNWACDGNNYSSSGVYTCTSINNQGCLHTSTLNLIILQSSSSNETQTVCDLYSWNGNTYNISGVYTYTSTNSSGCTHTATLNLIVHYTTMDGNSTESSCNAFTWHGNTYTQSGVYTLWRLHQHSYIKPNS
jgi:hypothetical protein